QLRAEAEEEPPAILLTVSDANGRPVRTLTGPVTQGFHRVSWNLRDPAPALPRPRPPGADQDLFFEEPSGPLLPPGTYQVSLANRRAAGVPALAGPRDFPATPASPATRDPGDLKALYDFREKVARLQRAVAGALDAANALNGRLQQIKQALDQTPRVESKWKD